MLSPTVRSYRKLRSLAISHSGGSPPLRGASPHVEPRRNDAEPRLGTSTTSRDPSQEAGKQMRYADRAGRPSRARRKVGLATAALLVASTLAACGGGGGGTGSDAKASGPVAPASVPKLTDDPV